VAGQNFPKKLQPYYFAVNAMFIEAMKSREVSREVSICSTRLQWWETQLTSIQAGKAPVEPVGRMLQQVAFKTRVNLDLLKRLVAYQQFDIERGEMNTMAELEVYGENTRSLLLYLNLHLLEIDDRDANLAASHLGRCLGICDVIKKSPHMMALNRNQFPTEILLKHELYFDRIWDK